MRITLADENAMIAFGQQLAARLSPVDCMTLQGTLGAGKTTLVRAMLQALGVTGSIISPSFLLLQEYTVTLPHDSAPPHDPALPHGPAPQSANFCHMDGYRIESADEIEELGLDELLETSIVCIEWPEKCAVFLPESRLQVTIEIEDSTTRALHLQGFGAWKTTIRDLTHV